MDGFVQEELHCSVLKLPVVVKFSAVVALSALPGLQQLVHKKPGRG